MVTLSRYIGWTVVGSSVGGLLVLVMLDTFMAFIDEISELSNDHYQLWEAALYIVLTVPSRVFDLFPTAVLIGSLMGLGGLASHSELMAMRAAGVSVGQILRAVLLGGLVLVTGALVIGEGVAPLSEQRAQIFRSLAQSKGNTYHGGDGLWARAGNYFVHAEAVLPNRQLVGVEVIELKSDLRVRAIVRAQRAEPVATGWKLSKVRRSRFEGQQVRTHQADQEIWPRLIPVDTFDVVSVEPRDMAAIHLHRYINYLESNGLDTDIYRLAFWSRITTPLSSLVMLLLAVPFVFGPLRSVGVGQRLFIGVLVGLVFYIVNRGLSHVGLVYGLPPLLSAFTPLLIFLAAGLLALRRVR